MCSKLPSVIQLVSGRAGIWIQAAWLHGLSSLNLYLFILFWVLWNKEWIGNCVHVVRICQSGVTWVNCFFVEPLMRSFFMGLIRFTREVSSKSLIRGCLAAQPQADWLLSGESGPGGWAWALDTAST